MSAIDIDYTAMPRQVWLKLNKDGKSLEDKFVHSGNNVIFYNNGSKILNLNVGTIFDGKKSDLVFLSNIYQYSETDEYALLIQNESYQFIFGNSTGKAWHLNENYSFNFMDVDTKVHPDQIWLRMKKNGQPVEDQVVAQNETYKFYNNGLLLFQSNIKTVFGGRYLDMLKLTNVYHYSEVDGTPLIVNENQIFYPANTEYFANLNEKITLDENYKIVLVDGNYNDQSLWLRLYKDDTMVDEVVLEQGLIYSYSIGAIEIISTKLDMIFMGMTSSIVLFKDLYQYSEVDGSLLKYNDRITLRMWSSIDAGISLTSSSFNNIRNNNIQNNNYGTRLTNSSTNNIIELNIFSRNTKGIYSENSYYYQNGTYIYTPSENNLIYHNSFLNNTQNAYDYSTNKWDFGYFEGGNYWSDYTGIDVDNDGIGDIPYYVGSGKDDFPLMEPWNGIIRVPKTIYVDDDFTDDQSNHKWNTIQKGISDSHNGDTIFVYNGTYYENLIIDKQLTLIGIDIPVVNGGRNGNAIEVTVDHCTIDGFTFVRGYSGIYLNNADSTKLTNNTIFDNSYGIRLYYSAFSTLRNNDIRDNSYNLDISGGALEAYVQDIDTSNTVNGKPVFYLVNANDQIIDYTSNAGYVGVINSNGITIRDLTLRNNSEGILFYQTNDSRIENVDIYNSESGILLENSYNNYVANNSLNSTGEFAIYLSSSANNTLRDNNVNSNYLGLIVIGDTKGSYNNSIGSSNTLNGKPIYYFYDLHDTTIQGLDAAHLTVASSDNVTISNNNIKNGDIVFLPFLSNSTIVNNTIQDNLYGIYLYQLSNNNTVYHNNLINNTINAIEDYITNLWDNGSEGNYWSDYTGTDSDDDGIGDTPYLISGDGSVDNYPLVYPYTDEPASYQNFTFAHISDVHIGYNATNEDNFYEFEGTKYENGLPINRILRFAETLWQISNENPKPKFLLITGDDAHYSNEQFFTTFTELLDMNSIPYYNVAGNHDSSLCVQQNQGCIEDDALSNYNTYVYGLNDFAFNYEDYRFVGLYSGKAINGQYELSGLSVDQLENLENNLGDNSKKQVIFTHAPVINLNQTTRDRFKNYTMGNNVELVLSGHMHFDEILDVYENIADENSPERPLFVTTRSATLSGKTYEGYAKGPAHTDAYGYRIFNVDKDGIVPYPSTETLSWTKLIFMVFSPVDIQIYDSQNRKTGMGENGIEYGIPDSYYIKGYENENITIPQIIWIHNTSDSYRLEITSNFTKQQIKQSVDSFNLTIRKEIDGSFVDINYYNVEIENNTISSVIINESSTNHILNIDIDGDGINDVAKEPDEIVDNTPPASVSEIDVASKGHDWINWTWTNPSDHDFNHTELYLNGTFITNIPASQNYYNATGLLPNTSYTPKAARINIIGGPYIGGNFWAHPNSTGFSQTCLYTNKDGLCEYEYILAENNIDYLPLANVSDLEPPKSITYLQNKSYALNQINFTWTNPPDPDYHHVMLFLNGTFLLNITAPQNYYSVTGLTPDTEYELGTHTVDRSGNINETWVNKTARTAPISGTTYSISLASGWNLISVPLVSKDTGITSVLSPINGNYSIVWAYNASDTADYWKKYDPNAPFGNDLTTMEAGKGYWILMTSDDTLFVTGDVPGSTDIVLKAEWNLIGYNSLVGLPIENALASVSGNYSIVWAYNASDAADHWKKYDPSAPFGNDLETMEQDKGYWIMMNTNDILT